MLLVKSLVFVLSRSMANVPSLFAMPPKTEKGRNQAREVAVFVKELYSTSGFSSWGEFARSIGVAPATMSDWQRAENAPSGFYLLKLMEAAEWRAGERKAPQLAHLESLEDKADAALTGIGNVLDLLRVVPDQSAADAQAVSPP